MRAQAQVVPLLLALTRLAPSARIPPPQFERAPQHIAQRTIIVDDD
jgi:hypothetical protein